ncbi:hypothetical protein MalM25_26510 [Planctomycetes bacterium MalM25]|nr:hypothetical protein MalM25_26510 [Planctomycetes bacterium MalM25]
MTRNGEHDMSTPEPSKNQDDWSPCPAGMLCQLGGRMRDNQTRRTVLKTAGGVATLALAAVLAVNLMPCPTPGGISCDQCVAQMPAYNLYLTADSDLAADDLAADDAEAMATHLKTCPKCRNYFERKYPGVLAATVSAGLGWLSLAVLGARRV